MEISPGGYPSPPHFLWLKSFICTILSNVAGRKSLINLDLAVLILKTKDLEERGKCWIPLPREVMRGFQRARFQVSSQLCWK